MTTSCNLTFSDIATDQDDKFNLRMALHGHLYYFALCDFANVLRNYRKYDETLTADQEKLLNEITDKFYAEITERDITLGDDAELGP